MRLIPSDPDIQTLVRRIKDQAIDLQPDFQRGLVWPREKSQRLIDSILRDWHVPPIHVVRAEDDQVVLDGQQRLQAICDFVDGRLTVNGAIEPHSTEIASLEGCTYAMLPEKYRRRFDRFTIRLFEIIDYGPEEPYELFYRLNEPTSLTASEKRNAFFGPAREQVKELVRQATEIGMNKERIGFSNSRMAYDDALARFCLTIELDSLRAKVTSSAVTAKYRSREPFSDATITRASRAVNDLLHLPCFNAHSIKLNKATLHTWLCFVVALRRETDVPPTNQHVSAFLHSFELTRSIVRLGHKLGVESDFGDILHSGNWERNQTEAMIRVFNDRASARVADVSSVLLRDIIAWFIFDGFINHWDGPTGISGHRGALIHSYRTRFASKADTESILLEIANDTNWGEFL